MQGIYIIVNGRRVRPPSKVAIRRHLEEFGPGAIKIEATSLFGNEYDGSLEFAPSEPITFVGPDPYTSRKYYGTISPLNGDWSIK